jgi:hypothetical protein
MSAGSTGHLILLGEVRAWEGGPLAPVIPPLRRETAPQATPMFKRNSRKPLNYNQIGASAGATDAAI